MIYRGMTLCNASACAKFNCPRRLRPIDFDDSARLGMALVAGDQSLDCDDFLPILKPVKDRPREWREALDVAGLTDKQMRSRSRNRVLARQRWKAWAHLYALGHWSYPQIGRRSNRDHTTVLHGVKRLAAEQAVVG